MSLKVYVKVMEDNRLQDPIEALALGALANWGDDDGRCWRDPRMARVAAVIRRSKKTAQRVVTSLIARGFLSVLQEGGGLRPHVYQLYPNDPIPSELPAGMSVYDTVPRDRRSASNTPPTNVTRDIAMSGVRGLTRDIAVSPLPVTQLCPGSKKNSNEDDDEGVVSSSDFSGDGEFNDACRALFAVKTAVERKKLSYKRKMMARSLVKELREMRADTARLSEYESWWRQDWRCAWDSRTRRVVEGKFQLPTMKQVVETWAEAMVWTDLNAVAPQTPESEPVARYAVRRRFDDAARS